MTQSQFNYHTQKTKNHWSSVYAHSQNGAVTVLLFFLAIKAANTLLMPNNNQITIQLPYLQVVLATGPNSQAGSGYGSTQNRTVATRLTTRTTQPIGNGPVFHQKPGISCSQVWLQLSIWVLIVSWHDQYVDCAVSAALSPPAVRFAIRPVFVESLSKTRQFGQNIA